MLAWSTLRATLLLSAMAWYLTKPDAERLRRYRFVAEQQAVNSS